MTRLPYVNACLLVLMAAACTPQQQVSSHSPAAPHAAVQTNYASDGSDCNSRAQKRMAMYDKPDTYPISDGERHDAFLALYSACMKEHNWQVAGPVRSTSPNDPSQLATLSPAAGGKAPGASSTVNAGGTTVSTTSVPGATVVVIGGGGKDIASQLSSLSPSSGGAASPNATVVLVQSPGAAAPVQGAYAPAAPLPVAVAVPPPPVAKGYYAPVTQPVANATPSAAAEYQPQVQSQLQPHTLIPAQPSLAGADAAVTGTAPAPKPLTTPQRSPQDQLENILEK